MPPRLRIPSYAVWDTVVFALNVLAFIFIGLQIRPILEDLDPAARGPYLVVAASVLATVIVVRIGWHMSFNAVVRWRDRRHGFHPPRPMMRPTVGTGLVISWAGMRGIVTLAAALALPEGFPNRDLILLTASAVVLGTLVIQGLTLKPLLRLLDLRDDDYVGREIAAARERAIHAGLESIADDHSPAAGRIRESFHARPGASPPGVRGERSTDVAPLARALRAARQAVVHARQRGDRRRRVSPP